ncbi:hypothetical protein CLAFUW4_06058 [Fulvia fulva]|uniref:Uncharacterized protein n=1 Tax=Passalora fulva TaxID=5499 RepID=A0A9Q8LIH2_PASFU|nr:uncharacterized protein CLAFUR5_06202 [Fulvia fulva]KAK4624974.1 hypothetical protein CLAFUR0_06066 [Fulvia fulva]UJO18027.1 hypothetical protein CLAFUR5_06202 [Fulvia fulva]WPV14473.1 hypothetical protein CLAFUW4_06058 [Fulvia fulva]
MPTAAALASCTDHEWLTKLCKTFGADVINLDERPNHRHGGGRPYRDKIDDLLQDGLVRDTPYSNTRSRRNNGTDARMSGGLPEQQGQSGQRQRARAGERGSSSRRTSGTHNDYNLSPGGPARHGQPRTNPTGSS